MVMEAVAIKVAKLDRKQEHQDKAEEFKKDKEGLDNLRKAAAGG